MCHTEKTYMKGFEIFPLSKKKVHITEYVSLNSVVINLTNFDHKLLLLLLKVPDRTLSTKKKLFYC